MQTFFTVKDNFENIINKNLSDVLSIVQVKNGWTNFVFEVETKQNGTYIFRFPRNEFFSDKLNKEIEFSKFIQGKLTVKTVSLEKLYEDGRLFSRHKKLEGKMLSNVYKELSTKKKKRLAKDICFFLNELKSLKCEDIKLELASKFLDDLSIVTKTDYNTAKHDVLKDLETELVLSHGDLNPGNILMDKNYNLTAVLDFAFISVSSPLNDLSRIIGRLPKDFENIMLTEYNKMFKTDITNEILSGLIDMWGYVEEKYIEYMKIYHKDIELPTLVRE